MQLLKVGDLGGEVEWKTKERVQGKGSERQRQYDLKSTKIEKQDQFNLFYFFKYIFKIKFDWILKEIAIAKRI